VPKSIDQILQDSLRAEPEADSAAEDGGESQEIDVMGLVEDLGKTAEALVKAAEALPSTPATDLRNMRFLRDPIGVSKAEMHDDRVEYFAQAMPAARASLRIPTSIKDIYKTAGAGESLARRVLMSS